MEATVGGAVDHALTVLAELRRRGEVVEDEWQYLADLETVWGARLREVAAARGGDPLSPAGSMALARLTTEAGLVEDPHRAIDWLSTFPQAALLALGEVG